MSTTTRTETKQAHKRRHPCEVCGSYDEAPRGKGIRCAGFTVGSACFCTRDDHAGGLPLEMSTSPPSFKHRLAGPCGCGTEHAPGRATVHNGRSGRLGEPVAVHNYTDESGAPLFQTCRYQTDDGAKTFRFRRPNGNGGWTWNMGDTPRVLYRLREIHDADPAAPVFVVEGEKDADTLARHGLIATTNPAGAGKWRPELHAPPLAGRRVVVLQDEDEPGRAHAQTVLRSLYGKAASLQHVRLTGIEAHGKGADVSDWLVTHTPDELLALVESAPEWTPHTQPVGGSAAAEVSVPRWPTLDAAVLQGPLGAIVRTIEPETEADPAALLVQLLVAFGNVIGRGPHFKVGAADVHYLNLFAALVGATSKGRKGLAWNCIKRLVESADQDWYASRIQSGLSTGEGLIHAVRDPIYKDEPVKEKGHRTGQYESVRIDSGVEDKRLLAEATELASVLRVLQREGNTLSAVVRQAWDSGDLRVLTRNNPVQATGAHISMVAHITQDELRRYLDRTELGNGFANRFLWVCVRRSRLLPDGGNLPAINWTHMVQYLGRAVGFARGVGEMKRDAEARTLWHEVYGDLTQERPGLLGAVTSRAEAQTMRLACLYALADESEEVRREHLEAALAVWQYCDASAAYIWGATLGDPVADSILGALRTAGQAGLTQTGISDLFGRNKSAAEIARGLRVLQELNLVRCETEQTGERGRAATRWFAVQEATK